MKLTQLPLTASSNAHSLPLAAPHLVRKVHDIGRVHPSMVLNHQKSLPLVPKFIGARSLGNKSIKLDGYVLKRPDVPQCTHCQYDGYSTVSVI